MDASQVADHKQFLFVFESSEKIRQNAKNHGKKRRDVQIIEKASRNVMYVSMGYKTKLNYYVPRAKRHMKVNTNIPLAACIRVDGSAHLT
jgi:hypothetical protein